MLPAGQKKGRKERKDERKQRVAARKAERTGLPKQVNEGLVSSIVCLPAYHPVCP
jgi:hypothetical protein